MSKHAATALLLIAIISGSGCNQITELAKPKPVEVVGLGALTEVAARGVKPGSDLLKVVLAATKQRRVNEQDAQAMLQILKQRIDAFITASGVSQDDADLFDYADVEEYLTLVLQHETLRAEVERTTQEAIVESTAQRIKFDKDENAGGAAGEFAAAYVNAYNRAVSKDDEKQRDAAYAKQQTTNRIAVLAAFERAAHRTLSDKAATPEQKREAAQFVQDLQTYNNALPAGEKVLGANGRLVSIADADDTPQQSQMQKIVNGNIESGITRTPELEAATTRLSNRMSATFSELTLRTNAQIKR